MNTLKSFSNTFKITFIRSHFLPQNTKRRFLSTISEENRRQCELFDKELRRQREDVGRIEKIDVHYEGPPENCVLTMNKNLSTPFDCAKHMGDKIQNRSAVALLNGETLWHMHKPLPDTCKLEFLHYKIANPTSVNKVFWRTCSFILGGVISAAFKDNIELKLHSFPSPNVKSGSFVYDVQLGLDDWKPTTNELKVLSIEMSKFCMQNLPIQTLDVDQNLALDIFKENPHKTQQIPDIAAHNGDKITLYKAGYHVDISRGPMVQNTGHIGRVTIANVFKLNTDIERSPIYRFQGVALPRDIILNHFAYGLIEERAKNLNSARIPGSQNDINEDNSFVAQITA